MLSLLLTCENLWQQSHKENESSSGKKTLNQSMYKGTVRDNIYNPTESADSSQRIQRYQSPNKSNGNGPEEEQSHHQGNYNCFANYSLAIK